MNFPLASVHKTKVGTCPHGLPMGACPICNGGGGGGGSKKTSQSSGEMSWEECFAIGQMMKAQKLAQQKKDVSMQAQLHAPLNIASRLENLAQSMAQKFSSISEKLTNFIQKSQTTPNLFTKTIALVAKIALPVINILKNIATIAQKTINFVREKFADITDKLNAVFGELKNSAEKKISDKFNAFKKKAKSLFGIFEPLETENEEKRIEENKRTFELKTAFKGLKKLFTQNKNLKESYGSDS